MRTHCGSNSADVIMFPKVWLTLTRFATCAICGGEVLDTKMFLKIFINISCVRAARKHSSCHGRATSQDTMSVSQGSSYGAIIVYGAGAVSSFSIKVVVKTSMVPHQVGQIHPHGQKMVSISIERSYEWHRESTFFCRAVSWILRQRLLHKMTNSSVAFITRIHAYLKT